MRLFVAKSAVLSIFIQGTGAVLLLLTEMLCARHLGLKEFNLYSTVTAWMYLLTIFAALGLNQLILKLIPEYLAKENYSKLKGIILKSNKWVMITSTLISLFCAMGIYILKVNELLFIPFLIAFIGLPFNVMSTLRQASMRALGKIGYALTPEFVIKPALLLFFLFILIYFNIKTVASNVLFLSLTASIFAFIIGNAWQKKHLAIITKKNHITYDSILWKKMAFPLFLIVGLSLISTRLDIAMLSIIRGTDDIGVYSASSRISEIMVFCLASTNAFVVPTISSLYSQRKKNELEKFIKIVTRSIALLTLPLLILLIFFGNKILLFFGEGFNSGYVILNILILGQSSSLIAGPVGPLLMMTGNQNEAIKHISVSALINFILNILLIPKWGMLGAAISTSTSLIILNLTMFITVRRKLNINPTIF